MLDQSARTHSTLTLMIARVAHFFQPLPAEADQPIDYWSKTVDDEESAYEFANKECPAVDCAVFLLRTYPMPPYSKSGPITTFCARY